MKIGLITEINEFLQQNYNKKKLFEFMKYIRNKYYPYLSITETTKMLVEQKEENKSKYHGISKEDLIKIREEYKKRYSQGETHLLEEIEEINKILTSNTDINNLLTKTLIFLNYNKIKLTIEDIKQLTIKELENLINEINNINKEIERKIKGG
ncbi:MAG: hypothetical protein QXU20_03690 [Candidatus Woesearchaeota archaeon]